MGGVWAAKNPLISSLHQLDSHMIRKTIKEKPSYITKVTMYVYGDVDKTT